MLYLDFDGVLSDSAPECMEITQKALDVTFTLIQKKVFLENRYLVNEPYGFFILAKLIITCSLSTEKYNILYKKTSDEEQNFLNKKFFDTRNDFIKDIGLDAWMDLNKPTEFFYKVKQSNFDLIIVSTKNKEALINWLDYYDLRTKKIYGNECYRKYGSKFNIIKKYKTDNGKVFIDDNPVHIDNFSWSNINCTPLIAGWGYNCFENNMNEVEKIL